MPKAKKTAKKAVKKTIRSKKLSIFGRKLSRLHLASFAAVLLFASVGAYLVFFSKAATGSFIKVATHPQASVQSTASGKSINALKSWNGKLYAGYGDYGANTGPITVNAFDGTNFASTLPREQLPRCEQGVTAPEACNSDTEAIYLYRELSGKLFGASIDPKGNNSNYVYGSSGLGAATWKNPPGFAEHAFDVATLTGTDLWVLGSMYDDKGGIHAAAWRSLDGGTTWQQPKSWLPANTSVGCGSYPNFARIYGAGVYGGKLYAVVTDCYGGAQPTSKVFDSVTNTWSDGPKLPTFNSAQAFAGKMVFQTGYHAGWQAGSLMTFDGTKTASVSGIGGVWNYTIEGNEIYILGTDNSIKKSTDLVNWNTVATAPTSGSSSIARSIAVYNGFIYLGGTDSSIYKQDFSSGGGNVGTDTVAPVVNISSPINGATLGNRVNIQASSTDNVKVTKMEIYDGSTLLKASTSGSIKYGWNTRNIVPGPHTITVKAYDAAGNVGQASVTVNR